MRYTPENRQQWRNWLNENHAKESEVWLVFLKQHTEKPNLSCNDAVEPELHARPKNSNKAATFFSSLAPSYQRQFIVWIATAKRPETKKRRLDEAIELLGRGEKPGMR